MGGWVGGWERERTVVFVIGEKHSTATPFAFEEKVLLLFKDHVDDDLEGSGWVGGWVECVLERKRRARRLECAAGLGVCVCEWGMV